MYINNRKDTSYGYYFYKNISNEIVSPQQDSNHFSWNNCCNGLVNISNSRSSTYIGPDGGITITFERFNEFQGIVERKVFTTPNDGILKYLNSEFCYEVVESKECQQTTIVRSINSVDELGVERILIFRYYSNTLD